MATARNRIDEQHAAAQEEVVDLLGLLRRQFYIDVDERVYFKHRQALVHAITWPAAWLGGRGLCVPADRYRDLIVDRLLEIKKHGDWDKHQKYFPRYLLKCIQEHFRHHGDALYEEFKSLSFTVDRVLGSLTPQEREEAPLVVLAKCHEITRPQPRKRKPKPQPDSDPQQTLL
ncbi:MAG: hypothetical protein AAGF10_07900 [Verrucomicrobiota bacterium]